MFVGWKAKYGKTYRDVGEEKCRYMLFMGNRRVVVRLNATAGGQNMYGLNQFGDLTNEEVQQRCYPEMEDRELSARCQAAVPDPGSDTVHERLIWYQVIILLTTIFSLLLFLYMWFLITICIKWGLWILFGQLHEFLSTRLENFEVAGGDFVAL